MTFREAVNMIMRAVPGPKPGEMEDKAKMFLRSRQLDCAARNHKGWAWLKKRGYARNEGGYKAGTMAVTQNSTTITLTGGTLPSTCVGWRFGLPRAETELYTIVVRTSGTEAVLDRPYEGETVAAAEYRIWDPVCRAPNDLDSWQSIQMERHSMVIGYEDLRFVRGQWPSAVLFGGATIMTLAEMSSSAGYSTGSVTLTKGSATVKLATGTWPSWSATRHVRFSGETTLYKIATRTSDTDVVLDRAYGGMWQGAGHKYELDPPGAYQLEVSPPQEDQFVLKIEYFAWPQELVNDSDRLEGPEAYQRGLIHLASGDLLLDHAAFASMDPENATRWQAKIRAQERLGNGLITSLLTDGPVPDEDAYLHMMDRGIA